MLLRYFFHLWFALIDILSSDVTGQRKWDFRVFFNFLWKMGITVSLTSTFINHFIMVFWQQSYVRVIRNFTAYYDRCRRGRRQLPDPSPSNLHKNILHQVSPLSYCIDFFLLLDHFRAIKKSCYSPILKIVNPEKN